MAISSGGHLRRTEGSQSGFRDVGNKYVRALSRIGKPPLRLGALELREEGTARQEGAQGKEQRNRARGDQPLNPAKKGHCPTEAEGKWQVSVGGAVPETHRADSEALIVLGVSMIPFIRSHSPDRER